MKSLIELSTRDSMRRVQLDGTRSCDIRELHIRLPANDPVALTGTSLKSTYTSKPLVRVGDEPVFGELAIVRLLQKDGWEAVWVDTFHGRKFWKNMPHKGSPCSLPAGARRLYDRIVESNNGRPSGFFDVMAWRDGEYRFAEYKGPGDKSNANELAWIGAAIRAGIDPSFLLFVIRSQG